MKIWSLQSSIISAGYCRKSSLSVSPICLRHCFRTFILQKPYEVRIMATILQWNLRDFFNLFRCIMKVNKNSHNCIQIQVKKPDLCDFSKSTSCLPLNGKLSLGFHNSWHLTGICQLKFMGNLRVFPTERSVSQGISCVPVHILSIWIVNPTNCHSPVWMS